MYNTYILIRIPPFAVGVREGVVAAGVDKKETKEPPSLLEQGRRQQ
jgi:hypothetical protein